MPSDNEDKPNYDVISDSERAARGELAAMLYNGHFTNGPFQIMCEHLRNTLHLFEQVHPFNIDQRFMASIKRAAALEFRSEANTPAGKVFIQQNALPLKTLRHYFTILQATRQYSDFATTDPRQNTRSKENLIDFLATNSLQSSVRQESYRQIYEGTYPIEGDSTPKLKFKANQVIRGDGNCYFRAVIRLSMESAILAEPRERNRLFTHYANLIQQAVLDKPTSCFRQDFDSENSETSHRMADLVSTLRLAASSEKWESLQDFWHDLVDPTEAGDDYRLIQAFRYVIADYLTVNQHREMPNGVCLSEIIMPSYQQCWTFDAYRKIYITTMGLDAEGVFIQLNLLPAMLGFKAHFFMITDTELTVSPTDINVLNEAFRTQHQLDENFPYTHGGIRFAPGHYEAFIEETVEARMIAHQQQAPVKPFNFIQMAQKPAELDQLVLIQAVQVVINRLLEKLMALSEETTASPQLLASLIKCCTTYLENNDQTAFKKTYVSLASSQKETRHPFLQQILNVFRCLFNYLDRLWAACTGQNPKTCQPMTTVFFKPRPQNQTQEQALGAFNTAMNELGKASWECNATGVFLLNN